MNDKIQHSIKTVQNTRLFLAIFYGIRQIGSLWKFSGKPSSVTALLFVTSSEHYINRTLGVLQEYRAKLP